MVGDAVNSTRSVDVLEVPWNGTIVPSEKFDGLDEVSLRSDLFLLGDPNVVDLFIGVLVEGWNEIHSRLGVES